MIKKTNNSEIIKVLVEYFRKNSRYLIVLVIFAFVIWVNYNTEERTTSYQLKNISKIYARYWETQEPSLDNNKHQVEYKNVFSSEPGDVYRLSFIAKSNFDEKLIIKIKSDSGDQVEIGQVEFQGSVDQEDLVEMIFSVNGQFQNIIIERGFLDRIESDVFDIIDGTKPQGVYISGLILSKIDSGFKDKDIFEDTIFGETGIEKSFVFLEKNNSFGKNGKLANSFDVNEGYLAFLDIRLSEIDFEDKTEYKFSIIDCGGNSKKNVSLWSVKFSLEDLKKQYIGNDQYRFDVLKKVPRGTLCLLMAGDKPKEESWNFEFSAIDDKDNSEEGSVRLTNFIYLKNFFGKEIAAKSRQEDLGKNMSFVYQNNGYITDFFDLFEYSNSAEFDWKKRIVVVSEKKGEYFMYKFSLEGPFEKFRIEAEQFDKDKNQFGIAYSFDKASWKEIEYSQNENESQKFDFVIDRNNSSEIFIKVFFKGERERPGRHCGLKNFKVSAIIQK